MRRRRRRRKRTRSWTHSNNKRLRVDPLNWDINVTVDEVCDVWSHQREEGSPPVWHGEKLLQWDARRPRGAQLLHSQPLPFITHTHTHTHGERHPVPARWGKSSQDMMKRCKSDTTRQLNKHKKKKKKRRKEKKNLFMVLFLPLKHFCIKHV